MYLGKTILKKSTILTLDSQSLINIHVIVVTKIVYKSNIMALPRVFFDIKAESFGVFSLGGSKIGRIVVELRSDVVPLTAENYRGK